ncbi:MAG: hypothetical protein NUV47_00800 [Patescibacteria group bacterium]|nr:hypothetical protein [Patescibacteria group bacterium]
MKVGQIINQLELQRGHRNEERVVNAVLSANLPWIHSVQLANKEEDCHGIDVVINTDVGKLFFQIKSSYYGKKKFLYTHRKSRTRIAIIVLNRYLTEKEFQKIVEEAIQSEYQTILAMRE